MKKTAAKSARLAFGDLFSEFGNRVIGLHEVALELRDISLRAAQLAESLKRRAENLKAFGDYGTPRLRQIHRALVKLERMEKAQSRRAQKKK